jgi:hypothetical protein
MTSPLDYNQHLLSYLQAWRQLLEASAAMTSAIPMPGMPSMPSMPAMPFAPPMAPPGTSPPGVSPPTDYTQQLFGYLQAWRQYLEQAINAPPGTPAQPTGSQPTTPQPTGSQSTGSTDSQSTGSQSSGSQSSFGATEQPIVLRPRDPYGTISDNKILSELRDLLNRPEITGFASADPTSGSAFAAKAASIASGPSIRPATQSLFSRRAADTPAATGMSTGMTQSLFSHRAADTPAATGMSTGMQTGRDPRLAAPPATSRWWEAGRGLRPGFKDKPDATNLVNIRPLYLGGEQ